MRCIIPQGRKDGKPVKGIAFNAIVAAGEKPGEGFAALSVLHKVENGKPLERLLGPEYKDTWLSLDTKKVERDKNQARRAEINEDRKERAERRERFEKNKESATLNISAKSRQMIEDALLEHKTIDNQIGAVAASSSATGSGVAASAFPGSTGDNIKLELMDMGFSEFDATDASRMSSSINEAVDYLCLNLDESELPQEFAPSGDFEVVQFYSGTNVRGFIDPKLTERLMRYFCLSKQAAQRALRSADGNFNGAALNMYNTLTHDILRQQFVPDSMNESNRNREEIEMERSAEEESVLAIYGEDALVQVGAVPQFGDKWAAVVKIKEGFHGIDYHSPLTIAIIDIDGFYPCSAPLVLIASSPNASDDSRSVLNTAQKRLLMRAAAGEIASLRRSSGAGLTSSDESPVPVPVVHSILSFLVDASREALMSAASQKPEKQQVEGFGRRNTTTKRTSGPTKPLAKHSARRRVEKPLPVSKPRSSPELSNMLERRTSLPAHKCRSEILRSIRSNQVTVVSGATGSGKTTQVPQFLLEEAADSRVPISIVCTQPRRIAAISVAERVAAERCQRVGESVGYQVKLNTKRSAQTRLVFCTTGVLLRRLQGDPNLESLTHVLIDEVHERSVETDFLLLLVREIIANRPGLRVVLMSATLDAEKFASYFSLATQSSSPNVPVISIPGRTFPVDQYYLEDVVSLTKYNLKPGDRHAKKSGKVTHTGKYGPEPVDDAIVPLRKKSATEAAAVDDPEPEDFIDGSIESTATGDRGSQVLSNSNMNQKDSRRVASLIDESIVNIDLIDLLVKRIDEEERRQQRNGAILIFLPGAAEISSVIQRLSSGFGKQLLWPLPLHSLLSPDEQARVFARPPKGKRKVICATNIAETSITVEDVTTVIDTLRAKEMSYDSLNGSSVLQECFISKAAAKQRAGRAGRVSKGICYRLVRTNTFEHRIAAQQIPEIQRVALEHLVLNILSIIPASQIRGDPHAFLAKAVDPPESQAVSTAVENLIAIGALRRSAQQNDQSVSLTALGKHLSGLPVDARIGKLLIYGSLFGCMDAALTMAATISERSPFFSPFAKREESRLARMKFASGNSDLLTYVNAFDAWRDIKESRMGYKAEQEFCNENFLSRKTLQTISDGRKQLADAITDAGFGISGDGRVSRGWERDEAFNRHGKNGRVLKAVICAALYPNVARIDLPETTYHEVAGGAIANQYKSKDLKLRAKTGERLFLHPESVNFHVGNYETRWLAYFTKVRTSKLFIRDATMVSPFAILLFGGDIAVQHRKGQMSVDRWVLFKAPARVAVLARELRRQLDGLLMRKFEDTDVNVVEEGGALNDAIIRLIKLEY